MTAASATVHIDVDGVNVAVHCEHGDGKASYRVERTGDDVTVYLVGTPIQLATFARKIADACASQVMTPGEHERMKAQR